MCVRGKYKQVRLFGQIGRDYSKNYVEKVLMRKKVYEDLCVYKKRMLNLQVNN